MSWFSKRFYSKLYFMTTMPHGRSLSFFFGTLCLIPGFHLFVYSVHSTCIRWAFSMCQLLFKAHVITTVKKRDKYSCPCRNYILSYCGVYRTFNLWFGVIITKHCVIMIWEKVRFLICVLYPLTWYEKNPKSWKKNSHLNGQLSFEFELKY